MFNSEARTAVIPERVAGEAWLGSLGSVLVAYLLVTVAAAVWLPLPEVARAALALPALALIPLLVGSALLRLLPVLDQTSALDGYGRALVEWLVGSLALATLAVVLQLGGQTFLLQRFGLIALALAVDGAIAGHMRGMRRVRLPAGPMALALAIAVLLSIAPKALAARYAEFPLLTGNVVGGPPLRAACPAAVGAWRPGDRESFSWPRAGDLYRDLVATLRRGAARCLMDGTVLAVRCLWRRAVPLGERGLRALDHCGSGHRHRCLSSSGTHLL